MEDVRSCCHVCMELWANSIDSMVRLGANTTEHGSQMELYIILATLDKFECWNRTLNHKMILSQAKPVQCSSAMVGFS